MTPVPDLLYPSDETALLMLDPYNDFLSEGGKLYERIKEVAQAVDLFENLRRVTKAARQAGIQVFVVPHHRSRDGDYAHWKHMTPTHIISDRLKTFAEGSWGGEWHPEFGPQPGDIVVKEHWSQSGFANTDLNEQLRQHGIEKIILVGLRANTCLESTGRFGMELGYHVTLVKDATASFSMEEMHAAHEVNGPMFAHEILTTAEVISNFVSAV
nr:cysteine hydrolase [Rhizobium leguminosarum]